MPILKELGCHLLTTLHPVEETLELGVKIDRWGFDHLRVGDHTLTITPEAEYPNANALLAAWATITRRVRLSQGVTDPLRRHPVEIAQWVATLDRVSGGRAVLGLGAGERMNLDPFGIAYGKPYTRLREAAHIIKLLWRASLQEPANFHGEIYRLEGAFLQVRPKQRPHPPLYIGAVGPRMRRLAGEIGDGWVAMANLSPQTLKAHLQEVYAGLEASGREPEDFAVIPTIYTAVSEDYEEAFRQVEPKARGIMALDPQTLRELGLSRVAEEVAVHRLRVDRAQELRRWREVAQAIPRPVVESVVAIGTPDQCIERLEEFLEAGATHLIVCNVAGGEGEEVTYRAYAEKVKPYLEEQYGG